MGYNADISDAKDLFFRNLSIQNFRKQTENSERDPFLSE